MRFTTIWTLAGADLSEKLLRTRDWAAIKIAASLPLRVRYWVSILMISKATMNDQDMTPAAELVNKLDRPEVVR